MYHFATTLIVGIIATVLVSEQRCVMDANGEVMQ
jgi:hypothetical protein